VDPLPESGWPAVVCLGEVLTDFVALDVGVPLQHATAFHRAAGGAPANVAVALARLDTSVAFIGKVGGDAFGLSLRETLAAEGVTVRDLVTAPTARTALAFVGSDGQGGRSFVFYHAGTAHTLLSPDEVNRDLIEQARIFHFGSVTLAAEPSRTATAVAAQWARERGCLVSFDPNVRLEVWGSAGQARDTMLDMLSVVDIVKVSSDELAFLTGTADAPAACGVLRERGPVLAIVTQGGGGCYYQTAARSGQLSAIPVDSVDSLGAGDAFMAGFLACLAAHPDRSGLGDETVLVPALRFANAVGAITTTRYGAIPALPTRAQVETLLQAGGIVT
jgi:fructokinase